MESNVLIPSAKLVPEELQKIGKLPPIIYPLNEGLVFDYLYKQYRDRVDDILIICHENADKVHRRLKQFCGRSLQILDLPELDDLGHTIYYGLQQTERPVIINFADTLVMDNICDSEGDSFFYSESAPSETWTFFEEQGGVLTGIYDKTNAWMKNTRKLFVGVFQIMDTLLFRQCLESAFKQKELGMSSFYFALKLYSQARPLKAIYTDNWFDIGHADRYFHSKVEVQAREFNHIRIDRERGILRKNSDDREKFIGEVLWYLKLPTDVEYVRPRIFTYSTQYTNPFIEMEYYSYHTLHELFLYGDIAAWQWQDIFERIRFILKDFRRYWVEGEGIRRSLEEVYLHKTLNRLDLLKNDAAFVSFFENPMQINGTTYHSLDEICEILKKTIPSLLYDIDSFSIIHGDLCFANIMVDNNFQFIKVIDPRGRFGEYDIYGDPRYELAKLFHSVEGKYDYIIQDLMNVECEPEKAVLAYRIYERQRDFDLAGIFRQVFREEIGGDLQKIELIEALLFLSMIPLHGESRKHQYAMLGTGIEILARVIDIKVQAVVEAGDCSGREKEGTADV